jgi:hypothetical protein
MLSGTERFLRILLPALQWLMTQKMFIKSSGTVFFLTIIWLNLQDINIVKVIERPLTENERFMLAKAARCVAFSVCPIRLAPK